MSLSDPDSPSQFLGLSLRGVSGALHRLDGLLGQGSQALVFAATRLGPTPGRAAPAAIKLFRPSFLRSHGREAELITQKELYALSHLPPSPHLVQLLDRGAWNHGGQTLPWLALERVDGASLKVRVAETRQATGAGLEPRRALRVLGHTVAGLHALHTAGIVHRDIKPSNVLLAGSGADERTLVADLGVCRPRGFGATFGVGGLLGEPGFAAPELTDPARVGPRADVFSLGALAYWALSGEPMYQGNPFVIAALIAKEAHAPLTRRSSVHPAFAQSGCLPLVSDALAWATRHDPTARPESVEVLWRALGGAIARVITSLETRPAAPARRTVTFRAEDEDDE
jgi:serine/threonine protein kinase